MGIGAGPAAFDALRYDIGADLALEVMTKAGAIEAGALLASIDPWRSYPITAAQLTAFFATLEPGAPRFSILNQSQACGAIAIRTNWLRGPYIQTFALAPSVQGHGIGSAIMAFIEQQARAAQERNLWVAASDFNVHALRFYARHGFQRAADIEGLVRDDRTEILLRKRLLTA